MVKDSKIPLIEAMVVVKELCEVSTGKEHEMVRVPIEMPINGIKIDYTSIILCEKGKKLEVQKEISSRNIETVEDIKSIDGICHITTFKEYIKNNRYISFDENDGNTIQADINDEYMFINDFFMSFINMRDHLKKNNELIKPDDLFQLLAITKNSYKDIKKDKVRTK